MSEKAARAETLRQVEKPSRYIGGEFGLPERHRAAPRLRVILGFPDVYEVGMSHLGFRLLHASLAARPDLEVERVFVPWPDLQRRLQAEDAALGSLESEEPLSAADLLGLSVQYELSLPAVLKLLDLAHIPRRVTDRARGDRRWPILLVGGSGALNPEPLAPFVDCFFVGEADQAIHEIVDALAEVRDAPRSVQIGRLSEIAGAYVPELVDVEYDGLAARAVARPPARLPIRRRYVSDIDGLALPEIGLVPFCTLVHDRVAIEIQRGCSQGCRFCQAGFVTRPTRQRSTGRVLELARRELTRTGYQDLSLLSLSAGDHACLQEMLAGLITEHGPRRVAISLPSMRVEGLHPKVAEHVSRVRKTGFTLAPEAATDRLRRVINKRNTEEDLMAAMASVLRAGYAQLKLYFMIGLPTETEEDVLAIAELAGRLLREAQRVTRHVRLTVSISTFVPKPHTPFQWEAAPDLDQVRRKQRLLQTHLPRRIQMKWHSPEQSLVEAYLARADRRAAVVLDQLVTVDHPGLDAWSEHFSLRRWEDAFAAAQAVSAIPPLVTWLAARDPAVPLPWDHIDVGVERRYLDSERLAARAGRTRGDCSDGTCDACGVCPEGPLHRLASPGVSLQGDVPADRSLAAAPPSSRPEAVRVWFRKEGRARFISHLEMVAALERAARRAGLPLVFSEGFHPKPRMRFSPALPLGAESTCEVLEMGVSGAVDPREFGERLSAELPPGLHLERCEAARPDVLGRIGGVRWRIRLGAKQGQVSQVLEEARQRLSAGTLLAERAGGKTVDLSATILSLGADGERALQVECRFDATGTARPSEIVRVALGLDEEAASAAGITRIGWIFAPTEDARPTEIEPEVRQSLASVEELRQDPSADGG